MTSVPEQAAEREISVTVPLPAGPVEIPVVIGEVDGAEATVIVAHGAGAGKDHPFLTGFTDALRREGLSTARFDFPYVVAGRHMPGPATHAILAWRAVVDAVPGTGIVVGGGKSYGGRMASMAAAEGLAVDALVYLGYPLHPPGRPEKPRTAHLSAVAVPQLFIEGANDPFIQPLAQFDEAVAMCRDARVTWVEGGGHSFEVKGHARPADEIGASLAPAVADFVRTL